MGPFQGLAWFQSPALQGTLAGVTGERATAVPLYGLADVVAG
jgi:hypothetical protein